MVEVVQKLVNVQPKDLIFLNEAFVQTLEQMTHTDVAKYY